MESLKRVFRPEFINRVDKIVVFRPLTREQLYDVIGIQLKRLSPRVEEQGMKLEVTEAAKEVIAKEGYQPEFGARPLRRAIQNLVEDRLSEGMLSGDFHEGDTIVVDAEDGQIVLHTQQDAGALPAEAQPA